MRRRRMIWRDVPLRHRIVVDVDGCWIWIATKNSRGYGQISSRSNGHIYAHRFFYQMFVGPIPKGRELDHLCRKVACVRPTHLEAVSHRDNVMRGESPTQKNALKTHCIYGHPFDLTNTYFRPDRIGRMCRICIRIKGLRQGAKRRVAA